MSLNLADYIEWKVGSIDAIKLTVGGSTFWEKKPAFDGYLFGGTKRIKSFNRDGTETYWVSNTENNAPYASFTGDSRHSLIFKPAGDVNEYITAEGHVNVINSDIIHLGPYITYDNNGYIYSPSIFLSRTIDLTHIDSIHIKYTSTNIKTMDYGAAVVHMKMSGSSEPTELSGAFSFNTWNQRFDLPRATDYTEYTMNTSNLTGQWYIAISSYSWDSTLNGDNIRISDVWIVPEDGYNADGSQPQATYELSAYPEYVASNADDAPVVELSGIPKRTEDITWNGEAIRATIEDAISRKAWDEINVADDRTYMALFGWIQKTSSSEAMIPSIAHYFYGADYGWVWRRAFRCTCDGASCNGYNGMRGPNIKFLLCLRDLLNWCRNTCSYGHARITFSINSGFRCPTVNGSLSGSSTTSHHLVGQGCDISACLDSNPATDFGISGFTASTMHQMFRDGVQANLEHWQTDYGMTCNMSGDLYQEANGSWFTHFSVRSV